MVTIFSCLASRIGPLRNRWIGTSRAFIPFFASAWFVAGSFSAAAATLPNSLKVQVTAAGQVQTLNLHKRTARSANCKFLTWDSQNGYQEAPLPEVRTFRGTVSENPNALVIAAIDENNRITAAMIDRVYSHNIRWAVSNVDVSSQLSTPVAAAPMPSQTIANPRSGSTGTPKVGFKVPTGTSSTGVSYGGFAEFEVGLDLSVAAYNRGGGNVSSALAKHEYVAMLCEHMMARDGIIRVVYPTIVLRKENFYVGDPGSVSPGTVGAEWKKAPLVNYRWDNVCGSDGFSASGGIGRAAGGTACGATYHELTHLFGIGHWNYQVDTMGANQVSEGPMTVDKLFSTRKAAIDRGDFTQGQPYPDPLPPYTYVDIARTSVGTPVDIDVLANDFDANGDSLSVVDFTTSTVPGGTVTKNPNGTLRYTPPAGYVGKDIIVYSAKDNSSMGLKTREIVHIEVVNSGLTARYAFEETSGTVAANSVSTGPAADLNGANFATHAVPSPLGRGLRVHGVQARDDVDDARWSGIILGNNNVMPVPLHPRAGGLFTPFEEDFNRYSSAYDVMDGNYTFSTWFMVEDFSYEAFIASKIWHPEQRFGWDLQATGGVLKLNWRLFQDNGRESIQDSTTSLVPGRWYHTAVVFDRATQEIRLYLDGRKVATRANAFPGNGVLFNGRAPLCVGAFGNKKYCIDDSRVYTKALSDAEVTALKVEPGTALRLLGSSPLSMTAYAGLVTKSRNLWPEIFAAGNGSVSFSLLNGPSWLTLDAVGILEGTPPATTAGGAYAATVRATGSTGQTLNIPVSINLVNLDLGARLLAHWNFDEGTGTTAFDLSGHGKDAVLLGATWSRLNGGGYSLTTNGNSNQTAQAPSLDLTGGFTLMAWIKPGSSPSGTLISQKDSYAFRLSGNALILTTPGKKDHSSGNIGITGNTWQHVAVSFNPGAAGGAKFYVNGVLKASVDASAYTQTTNPTLLGKSGNSSTQGYSGRIDELKVYGFPITDDWIVSSMYSMYPLAPERVLKREIWEGVSGNSVANLTSSPKYSGPPDLIDALSLAEFANYSSAGYGARVSGWLTPQASGSFHFYVSADDSVELWLSSDENPANKTKIAYASSYTGNKDWTKYASQKSAAIALTANRSYYLEVLYKNGTGGNHMAVGWQPAAGGNITDLSAENLAMFLRDMAWDPSADPGIQGGTGVWNTLDANWTDGGGNRSWINGLGGTANFGGTVGTVTLNQTVSAGKLRFTSGGSSGYDLTGPGSIGFGNTHGVIDTSALGSGGNNSNTISAKLTGSAGLTISANGNLSDSGGGSNTSLRLHGDNSELSGGITLASGLVGFNSAASFGVNAVIFDGGGILATASLTLNNEMVVSSGVTGVVRVYNGKTFTLAGTISGSGALRKTDSGVLVLTGTNTYSGDTLVAAGTLRMTKATLADGAALRITGSAKIDLSHGLADTVGSIFVNNVLQPPGTYHSGNSSFVTGSGSLVVGGSSGGMTLYGSWLSAKGVGSGGEGTGAKESYDHSGVPNLVQFVLGADPADPADNGIQHQLIRNASGDAELVLAISVPAGTAFTGDPSPKAVIHGMTCTIEGSIDLKKWTDAVEETVEPPGGTTLVAPEGHVLKFFRLVRTSQPPANGFLRVNVSS